MKLNHLALVVLCTFYEQSCSEIKTCPDGYFGDRCATPCPKHCESTCDKNSGQCDHFCRKKFWGPFCKDKCPVNCLEGCDMLSGHCYGGCSNGWYGDNCYLTCPKECDSGICQRHSGKCIHGCNEGWQGNLCNMPCSEGCLNGSCFQNGTCKHVNTAYSVSDLEFVLTKMKLNHLALVVLCTFYEQSCSEIKTCPDGYFGDRCATPCPKHCESTCDKNSGQCDHFCRKKFWGPFCKDKCPVNCLEGCDMLSGHCYGGCSNGWYGDNCYLTCPKECDSGICQRHSGKCIHGCNEGWQGNLCNMPCSEGCLNGSCFQNGTCKHVNTAYSVSGSTASRVTFSVPVVAVVISLSMISLNNSILSKL